VRTRLLISTLAVAFAALAIAPATATAAATPSPAVCASTKIIEITHFAFTPPSVTPGHVGTANLTAVNCTAVSQQTSTIWTGQYSGTGVGLPPGCPVIDPIAMQANFAPFGTFQGHVGYLVITGCKATRLSVTVRFDQGSAVLAQATAVLNIIQPITG
jgi:hypothetical protein